MTSMTDLYRGYVNLRTTAGDEKKPAIKESDSYRYFEDVQQHQGISGILKSNICFVDTDDKANTDCVDRILEALNLRVPTLTTTKGKHYYFTIPNDMKLVSGSKLLFACGFEGDIKVGSTTSYDVIKYKGVERTFSNMDRELIPLPFFFTPLGSVSSLAKSFNVAPLTDLGEGDGRNDILFRFIIPLKQHKLTKENIEIIYRDIINPCVLRDRLPKNEIDSLLRDDAFDKVKEKSGKTNSVNIHEFTLQLMAEHNICMINGLPRFYEDGVYRDLSALAVGYLVSKELIDVKEQTINEIRHRLDYYLFNTQDYKVDDKRICFANGNFNLETRQLEPHTPDVKVVNKIPHNYNPDAYCKEVDVTLNNIACNEADTRKLFNEMIGGMLNPVCNFGKAFILLGDGANGKSTLLELIKNSFGIENTADLDLKDLSSTFRPSMLIDKMVNIGDDISAQFLDDTANFKKLVTGETIIIERKGIQPKSAKLTVKLLFAANDLPRIKNFGTAIMRRLVIVPCNAKFNHNNSNFDVGFRQRLNSTDAFEYVLKIGIDALLKLYEDNGQFTVTESTKEASYTYELENNPIKYFAEQYPIKEWEFKTTEEVYSMYREFCIENCLKSYYSKIAFSRKVVAELNVYIKTTILNGKRAKTYLMH